MKKKRYFVIGVLFTLCATVAYLIVLGTRVQKPEPITKLAHLLPDHIDYNLHVKSILSEKCYACHGPEKNNGQKAGLDLSTAASAFATLSDGKRAIVPGSLSESELYHRIISDDPGLAMPLKESGLSLTDYERAVLCKWIEQGAEFKRHWAFVAPIETKNPDVRDKNWPVNLIDYFVLEKLEKSRMKPSPEADKETLLRRVSLDLTGLPPSPEETDAFIADNSPQAYEKVVDRLLASKHYGEKMATDWLDVARYADTHGYTIDLYRPMWQWRDWVIGSFNNNMPFDKFITWQLAGDMLPNANREQKLATAFNRLHAQNMEGGIINEEFVTEYVVDRVNTFGTAFLGMTVSCARCHDHKYDPISQKDYYSLYSFFNNIDEVGQISRDNAMPVPTLLWSDSKQDSLLAQLSLREKTGQDELEKLSQQTEDFEKWKQNNAHKVRYDKSKGLQASFTFDKLTKGYFISEVNRKDSGYVTSDINTVVIKNHELPAGKKGVSYKSNGNDILRLGNTGIFSRIDPFSIGVWVKIPRDLDKGVILHTGNGDILYNFRGYYLSIRNGRAELLMAHSWPYNCIVKLSKRDLPKEEWVHLIFTYDGTGKANGLKLFVNGSEEEMITEKDNLYKDILFSHGYQPGLQVGADLRGFGFKNGLIDEVLIYNRELSSSEVIWLVRSYNENVATQTVADSDLHKYYLQEISKSWQQKAHEVKQVRYQKNKLIEDIPEIMVMDEMKEKKPAHILKRGVYDDLGEKVEPGVPSSILPFSPKLRKDRLGLAEWTIDPKNPLTSRVIVNRFWQTYFGAALQRNADNFGSQGGVPSHPELLDRLAIEFIKLGWNVKAFQKLIVMSATYKQSSFQNKTLFAEDPENLLLARGPGFRMSAEMLRDAALKASGLLSERIGGPSVKPYQPAGLWDVNDVESYKQDSGESLYRRGIYTLVKRTNPAPSMMAFDAPMRTSCTVIRQKTNTPMQALVLLNDPQFVEASRVVAANVMKKFTTSDERIRYCYRLLACRKPSDMEMAILTNLFVTETKKFSSQPSKMKGWLNAGDYNIRTVLNRVEWAALTVVANTIMNSDAFVTKR